MVATNYHRYSSTDLMVSTFNYNQVLQPVATL